MRSFFSCSQSLPSTSVGEWGDIRRGKVSILTEHTSAAKLAFCIDFSRSLWFWKLVTEDEVNIILFAQMVSDWIGLRWKWWRQANLDAKAAISDNCLQTWCQNILPLFQNCQAKDLEMDWSKWRHLFLKSLTCFTLCWQCFTVMRLHLSFCEELSYFSWKYQLLQCKLHPWHSQRLCHSWAVVDSEDKMSVQVQTPD